MATAPDLVRLSNGELLARGVYDAYLALRAAGARAGHNVYVSSGYRTPATQIKIFTDRYDQRSSGTGAYNDVRWWNGDAYGYPGIDRWVRVSPDGTVAVPGTSMHEKASAVDFGGIPARGGTAYANWMRANAPSYGFSPTGYGFGEAWHYDYTGNPWAGSGSTPFPPEAVMDARQEAILNATRAELGVVKQLLTETEQWKGIGWLVSQIYTDLGIVKQAIFSKKEDGEGAWDGIDQRTGRIDETTAQILTMLEGFSAPTIDLDALAEKIVAGLPAGTAGPTAEEIAATTRELFRTDPIK